MMLTNSPSTSTQSSACRSGAVVEEWRNPAAAGLGGPGGGDRDRRPSAALPSSPSLLSLAVTDGAWGICCSRGWTKGSGEAAPGTVAGCCCCCWVPTMSERRRADAREAARHTSQLVPQTCFQQEQQQGPKSCGMPLRPSTGLATQAAQQQQGWNRSIAAHRAPPCGGGWTAPRPCRCP